MDRTLWFPFSVKLCYVFVSQQQRQLALKTAGDSVFRPEPRTFSGSHRTESLAAGMKHFALCRWLRAKLSLESPENDIIRVLMSCCPEMGQVGSQRQKHEAQGFIPRHGIAQDAVQEGRQVLLPWISIGRVYRMWPRAKVSFCSFSMFDLSAFWTTT